MIADNKMRGFSLMELMVVVAIIAAIAAFAIPSYQDSVQRANRQDAIIGLTETAQRLERCYTEFNRYNHDNCPVTFPLTTPEGRYTIAVSNLNLHTYTLTATPVAGGASAGDARCTSLTLTHQGTRTATGSEPNTCW